MTKSPIYFIFIMWLFNIFQFRALHSNIRSISSFLIKFKNCHDNPVPPVSPSEEISKNKDSVSQQVWHGSNISVQKGHGAFSLKLFTVNDSVSMRGIFSSPKKNILELDVKPQTSKQKTSFCRRVVSPTLIPVWLCSGQEYNIHYQSS